MAINDNITLSKGEYSETIHCAAVTDHGENSFTAIKQAKSSSKQDQGRVDTKVSDLLRIEESYHVVGYICATTSKSAKTIKENIKTIFNGALINGGEVTMVYEDESIKGYIRKYQFDKKPNDNIAGNYIGANAKIDEAEYTVTIDFTKGVRVN